MSTFNERADRERREALRAARFEAFVQRTLAAQQAAERAGRKVCTMRERETRRQLVLEFQI